MKRNLLVGAVAASLALGVTPARAATFGVPDSDTAILSAMLFQAVADAAQMGHLVETTVSGLQTARQTLAFVRAGTDAVSSMAALTQSPEDLFNGVYQGFRRTFPEVEGLTAEAVALKNSWDEGVFSGDGTYDPYALQKLMRSLKDSGESALHTIVALDASAYNLTGENLLAEKDLAFMRDKHRAFVETIHMTDLAGGMTPQEASVLSAKAAVSSMQAQVQAAEALNTMTNIAKNEYLKKWDAAARAQGNVAAAVGGLGSQLPSTMELDAFSDETSAPPPYSDSLTFGGR